MSTDYLTALHAAAVAARNHALASAQDLEFASTRNEQIRLSILAAEANRVADQLEELYNTLYFSMSPYGLTGQP